MKCSGSKTRKHFQRVVTINITETQEDKEQQRDQVSALYASLFSVLFSPGPTGLVLCTCLHLPSLLPV